MPAVNPQESSRLMVMTAMTIIPVIMPTIAGHMAIVAMTIVFPELSAPPGSCVRSGAREGDQEPNIVVICRL